MSEQASEDGDVNAFADPRDEMRALVLEAAGPHAPWKRRVGRAADKLGLTFSRAKDLYYGDRRVRVAAEELERARHALKHQPVGTGTDATAQELAALVARLEAVADRLDSHGLGPEADRARAAARRMR